MSKQFYYIFTQKNFYLTILVYKDIYSQKSIIFYVSL